MRFLIDGYNLMHALGMTPKSTGLSLERSRLRLLEWLSAQTRRFQPEITVVFDSADPSGAKSHTHHGLRIQFSAGQTADDLIEQIVQQEHVPARLTAVSNDHRIKRSAQRRGCIAWSCGEFIDWLQAAPSKPSTFQVVEAGQKPMSTSQDEIDDWLKRFGGK